MNFRFVALFIAIYHTKKQEQDTVQLHLFL